jgi:hypothetical protein
MTRPANPETLLRELLLDLFTSGELRILMSDHGNDDLVNKLPVGLSADELFAAAVEALEKCGLIDEHLFQLLLARRPARADDITAVMRLFGPASTHDRALLERLHAVLGQPDPLAALELIREHSSYFFPSASDGPYAILHTPHLYAEPRILGLASTRKELLGTDLYTWTYFGVPDIDEPLLDRNDGSSGPAWSPSDAVLATVAAFRDALNHGPYDFRHDGKRHLFVGRRQQLTTGAEQTAWTSFKEQTLETGGVHIHTRDSLLRFLAVHAFGKDWNRVVPPDSPLRRPL